MMKTKRILFNLICGFLSQIVTILLGLMIPRLIMIGHGSTVNGLISSVTQFIVYLNLFEAGIQTVAKQALYKPLSIDDKKSINQILSAVNKNYRKIGTIYFLALIVLSLIYPLLVKDSNIRYITAFCVFLFSGLGNVALFFFYGKYRVLLQAEGKNYFLSNVQTVISILNNIVKIILLQLGMVIEIVIFASFVVSLLQIGYIYAYIKRRYSWIDLNVTPDHTALSQKNAGLLHQIAGMVFQNTDVLILTIVCGLPIVSVYSLYKMITSHLASLISTVYNSISFALGQLYQIDVQEYTKVIDTVEVYFSGLLFSIYTVTCALLLPFIRLYTRGVNDIQYANTHLCLLFIAVELLTYVRYPMLHTINYAGHFKQTVPQTIIETSINIVVSVIGVLFFGIYGVLFGTITALVYRIIDVFLYANRKLLKRSPIKTFSIYLVNAGAFFVLYTLSNAFNIEIATYFDFVKYGFILFIVAIIIYFSTLSLIFKKERKILADIVLSKFKKKGSH